MLDNLNLSRLRGTEPVSAHSFLPREVGILSKVSTPDNFTPKYNHSYELTRKKYLKDVTLTLNICCALPNI